MIRRCGFVYINQPEFHIFLRQCPHCPMYNVYIFIYNNVHTVHYKSNRPRGKVHYPEDLGTGQSDFFRTNCPFKYLLPPENVRRCHPSGSDGNSSHRQLFSPNFRLMTLAAPGFVQQRTKNVIRWLSALCRGFGWAGGCQLAGGKVGQITERCGPFPILGSCPYKIIAQNWGQH